jgi:hypothetical protein
LIPHLPYKRLNDFEIDWKSADIIRQGKHSKVYKAVDRFDAYAVKIINLPLTPTLALETIANEIWVTSTSNKLIGLEASDRWL